MDIIIKIYPQSYFSILPRDILIEGNKYNNVNLNVLTLNGILYITAEGLRFSIAYLYENSLAKFLKECDEFINIQNITKQNTGISESGTPIQYILCHNSDNRYVCYDKQLSMYYRLTSKSLTYTFDFITSSVIMKKLQQISNDIQTNTIKSDY